MNEHRIGKRGPHHRGCHVILLHYLVVFFPCHLNEFLAHISSLINIIYFVEFFIYN